MRKTATAAVLVCAALLTVSIASPAIGGPSIDSVAKTAKKALRTSKSAKRVANSANARASQALGRAGDGPGTIAVVDGPEVSDGSSVVGSQAACPTGYHLIGGGHTVGAFDNPAVSRQYGESFYGVIVANVLLDVAKAQAHATCAKGAAAGAARTSAADRREAVADFRADLRQIEHNATDRR